MAKHILKIRGADKFVFDAIKENEKTVETRANTPKYRKIKAGDILVFVCGDEKLEKRVEEVAYYQTIEELTEAMDFKKVMPFADTIKEMKQTYYSFPNYKEKIKQFGLAAFFWK